MITKISRRLLIGISFIICQLSVSMAQTARISGVVNDDMGPVMMCNVVEVDGNNRNVSFAQTDFNGNFSMTVKSTKNKLKVSYVGYKTVVLPIGSRTTFNIKLQSATQIKEVQVVAKRKFNQGGLAIPEREVSVAAQTFRRSEHCQERDDRLDADHEHAGGGRSGLHLGRRGPAGSDCRS